MDLVAYALEGEDPQRIIETGLFSKVSTYHSSRLVVVIMVPLEEGWNKINTEGIAVLEDYLDHGTIRESVSQTEGKPKRIFDSDTYMTLYSQVYNMCTQRNPNNWSEQLYKRYTVAIQEYVKREVIPALEKKTGFDLLAELLKRWQNHKIYVKWMEKFFTYLDRYFVKLQSCEPLSQRGSSTFQLLVFDTVKEEARRALIEHINKERMGEEIDRDLLKGVIEIFIDLSSPSILHVYQQDFEEQFLPDTREYYLRQSSGWLANDNFPNYMIKAENALEEEGRRVKNYLHRSTDKKLREVVIIAVLQEPMQKLLEKETAIVHLLENDKQQDLARAHRLFGLVENGLLPISTSFRQYVTEKGNEVTVSIHI